MISQKLFEDYFKGVYERLYDIDVRLDAVFRASSIKDSLEGKDTNSFVSRYKGEEVTYQSKLPKLLINIRSDAVEGLPFANDTKMVYTNEKLFFRIYTNTDLQILKRNTMIGIRRKQLRGLWNLRMDTKLTPAVSLEGFYTLTGNMYYSSYDGTAGTVRPIDNVEL